MCIFMTIVQTHSHLVTGDVIGIVDTPRLPDETWGTGLNSCDNYEIRTDYKIENLEHKRILEKHFVAEGRMITDNTKSLILLSEVDEYCIDHSWFI